MVGRSQAGKLEGVSIGTPSYFADLADGIIARRTGTNRRPATILNPRYRQTK